MENATLEIKRTSITRLKPPVVKEPSVSSNSSWNQKNLDYEIETGIPIGTHSPMLSLKSKEPRLRDWNEKLHIRINPSTSPWNQKNLDYEIETVLLLAVFGKRADLEIKRTSITRLKHRKRLYDQILFETWNQKNLDYEIETSSLSVDDLLKIALSLEIKRTSITRLKRT